MAQFINVANIVRQIANTSSFTQTILQFLLPPCLALFAKGQVASWEARMNFGLNTTTPGYSLKDCGGSGTCLYLVFALYEYGNEECWRLVKDRILAEFRRHPHRYKHVQNVRYPTFYEQINYKSMDDTQGDDLDIAVWSELKKCTIYVLSVRRCSRSSASATDQYVQRILSGIFKYF